MLIILAKSSMLEYWLKYFTAGSLMASDEELSLLIVG